MKFIPDSNFFWESFFLPSCMKKKSQKCHRWLVKRKDESQNRNTKTSRKCSLWGQQWWKVISSSCVEVNPASDQTRGPAPASGYHAVLVWRGGWFWSVKELSVWWLTALVWTLSCLRSFSGALSQRPSEDPGGDGSGEERTHFSGSHLLL